MVTLPSERADAAATAPHTLDDSQCAVVDLADGVSAIVVGAPGTGKTETLVELVAQRVHARGWSPEQIVVLSATRQSATALRDRLAARIDAPTLGPMARTANSLAFEVIREAAAVAGEGPPTLLTGAEQDQIISDLLAGEIADGTGAPWPAHLDPEVRRLRGFRTELRDLMMRCVEFGVTPADLAALGERTDRPEWVAASAFISVYDQVKASYRDRHFDASELLAEAAGLIEGGHYAAIDRLRLVVVDDAHELTEATISLVRALASRGITIIGFGDPDLTTGSFRGAQPAVLSQWATRLHLESCESLFLSSVHRHSAELRQTVTNLTQRIGVAGLIEQRKSPAVATAPSSIHSFQLTTPAEEIAFIARHLREKHVLESVPWSRMAVIVRTGSLIPSLARQLRTLEVVTSVSSARSAVRDEFSVNGLIVLLELALERRPLDAAAAVELLCSSVGGFDTVSLRRLKAALRHEALGAEIYDSADELIAQALAAPAGFVTIDNRVARQAAAVAKNLRETAAAGAAGDTIEELLWGAWQRSGLADRWFEQALGAGVVAEEANRHLDAVVALFSSAKRFVERRPDAPANVFLNEWLSADVAEDTLAARSIVDSVTVGTPASVIGQEFDVVVVAGMQENVWPNLRVRGSLLGAHDLPRVLAGEKLAVADRRREVLHDELRMFAQAVSRATSEVIVTAVAGDDNMPSPFLTLIPEPDEPVRSRPPLSLRGLVGVLRRELTTGAQPEAAAASLARLAGESVPGADPRSWYGLRAPSTTAPLVDLSEPDAEVRVSPSRMESFETCPLHWVIDQLGGSTTNVASNLGSLIHGVAETATDFSADALYKAVEERWGEMTFEASWQSEAEKLRAKKLTQHLATYLRDFTADGGELISNEMGFVLPLEQARLSGKIDRVEMYGGTTAVIVDLKTGKNEPSSDKAVADHPQLAAYQLAFASGAIDGVPEDLVNGGAKLVVLSPSAKTRDYDAPKQQPMNDEQLELFRQRVIEDARGMAGSVFVARVSSHCTDPWSFGNCRIHVVPAVSAR
ncbi:ATP-dependent DNA helicase [Salinibacterium sp. SWN248]|uniref:ATP-dependent helicase n=1 Tax=Salinibacterium sp. SWN248 TaxID=2792056 RepID=UPI0018CCBA68|nr:ATP-dependent DNA helicase [Salinibacterium sp. SWN248]MBH0024570.1 ATP-dependent helicase [Salinibacterium sp. SWN248]